MADKKTYAWRDPGRATAWAVGILAADFAVHLGFLALEAALGSASSYAAAPSAILTDPFKFTH